MTADEEPMLGLPRVRRHGKRAWSLLRRAKPFVLADGQGDYFVDPGGWAWRQGSSPVPARSLLTSKAACPMCGRKLNGALPQCLHGRPLRQESS